MKAHSYSEVVDALRGKFSLIDDTNGLVLMHACAFSDCEARAVEHRRVWGECSVVPSENVRVETPRYEP